MKRQAPLQMSGDEFRAIGHRLIDDLADRLAEVAAGPVTHDETLEEVRRTLKADAALPEAGTDASALVSDATSLLFGHSLFNGHPRFFGYITSSPAPVGMFGDLLATALNQNVGAWKLAPLATEIETHTVRWIAEFIGFPATCGGLLVSGGNMANFVCLLAARAAGAGWNVREEGVARQRLLVYASKETHTWIQKAADMAGLGTNAIRWIDTDAAQRIDTAALRRQIDDDRHAGHRPFMVIGTAGTVSTGAVDPLPEIAAMCKDLGLWFHVDGAYGALAAGVPGAPADLQGLAQADSVAVDPHKWLYAPLEAGCVLVRDQAALRNAFSYHPVYYHLNEEAVNYFEYGPQNSRGFRALKVWLALRHAGRSGYVRMISDDMMLSRRLFELVGAHPEFEAASQSLSITTFRFVPPELRATVGTPDTERTLDDLNQRLLSAVEHSGEAFLSNAVVNGRFMLRARIVNFNTTLDDIEALPSLIARIARQVVTSSGAPATRDTTNR
jgi:glutamate/tyrosine decarboxylase-like PLP-dependent enzyme